MSDKARRFWQIHLSTAVVVMITAGGLLALNCLHHEHALSSTDDDGVFRGSVFEYTIWDVSPISLRYGWPSTCLETYDFNKKQNHWGRWRVRGILLNAGVACGVLTVVAFGSEYLIRRRSKP